MPITNEDGVTSQTAYESDPSQDPFATDRYNAVTDTYPGYVILGKAGDESKFPMFGGTAFMINDDLVVPQSAWNATVAAQPDFLNKYGPALAAAGLGGLTSIASGLAAAPTAVNAGAGAFDAAGVGALGSADAAAAGLGGITAPAAGGALGAGLPTTTGGSMGFFDDILNSVDLGIDVNPWTTNPDLSALDPTIGGTAGGTGLDWSAIDSGNAVAPWTTDPSLGSLDPTSVGVSGDLLSTLKQLPSSLLKSIFASNPDGTPNFSKLASGGSTLGGIAAIAPSLAAINYARNQDPFDMTKLNDAYGSISGTGLTGQYDYNTGLGREQLTSNLQNRGVLGSSFGNMDLTNYNTQRDTGRAALLTGGAGTQANIANMILQGQIGQQKNKNDLYGRALLALSGIGASKNPLFA